MATNIVKTGKRVVVFDINKDAVSKLEVFASRYMRSANIFSFAVQMNIFVPRAWGRKRGNLLATWQRKRRLLSRCSQPVSMYPQRLLLKLSWTVICSLVRSWMFIWERKGSFPEPPRARSL